MGSSHSFSSFLVSSTSSPPIWLATRRTSLHLDSHASGVAMRLLFSLPVARAIGSRGGISSLLGIFQDGTPGSQASTAAVLRNLAKFAEIRQNFTEENAVVVLLVVASFGTVLAWENAIECLANLISEDENLRVSVVKEAGVECLRNFWDSGPQVQSLEVAVEVLRHLASSAPIAEVLVAEGFVERVMGVGCGGFVESVGVFPF